VQYAGQPVHQFRNPVIAAAHSNIQVFMQLKSQVLSEQLSVLIVKLCDLCFQFLGPNRVNLADLADRIVLLLDGVVTEAYLRGVTNPADIGKAHRLDNASLDFVIAQYPDYFRWI
jgi:hypothetical protein